MSRTLILLASVLTWGLTASIVACRATGTTVEGSIVVEPSGGGPETAVHIAGRNFPPATDISIRLGPPNVGATPRSYGEVTVGADGTFSLTIAMPGQWPDGRPIVDESLLIVAINEDGSIKATAPFAYTPAQQVPPVLMLKPPSGGLGQHVLVVGQGFKPGQRVALKLGRVDGVLAPEPLVETSTSAGDTFTMTLIIPLVWPDTGEPIVEQELVIMAVDVTTGQPQATAVYFNVRGTGEEGPPLRQWPAATRYGQLAMLRPGNGRR